MRSRPAPKRYRGTEPQQQELTRLFQVGPRLLLQCSAHVQVGAAVAHAGCAEVNKHKGMREEGEGEGWEGGRSTN